ncbi:GTPase domain-containing protein [Rossellomorea vietnamensis]|uniref:GTPase domain-containing protein n=1 Tax=Rossellomorea vietnamensis TaxID=218284 RepID=UPI00077C1D3A|nr:GTPase domain-containing protein [Rossellomorea vietnamensis]
MEELDFSKHTREINFLLEEVISILSEWKEDEIQEIASEFKIFLEEERQQKKLRIAFIGQYNAGKSSTIASLTRAKFVHKKYETIENEQKLVQVYQVGNKRLNVGAQIMTDAAEKYEWENVEIIDTPGIYAGRTDHDEKTLDQISKSDLLVFVVSNELFNPEGGALFRKLLFDMQRSGQMMLVINKMSREVGTPEILEKTILEVIDPYHPSDFYTSFVDANYYLEAQLEEEDVEEKEYLEEKSNFNSFIASLERLIAANQLTARLVTPLHRGAEVLEKSLNHLGTDNKGERDLLELLRRKASLIRSAKIRLHNNIQGELNVLEHQVIMAGEQVAGKVDGQHGADEINHALKETEQKIQTDSMKTLEKVQASIEKELELLQEELANLQDSSLGKATLELFFAKGAKGPSISERDISERKKTHSIVGKTPDALQQLGKFAGEVSKDTIVEVVKKFGVKFKPWGATKLTKFVNKLGPIISIVGVVLDVFFAAKEEYDETKHEQQLREARADLRFEFRKVAKEIRVEFEENIEEAIMPFFHNELIIIEQQQEQIRHSEASKEQSFTQMEILLKRIREMIPKIG